MTKEKLESVSKVASEFHKAHLVIATNDAELIINQTIAEIKEWADKNIFVEGERMRNSIDYIDLIEFLDTKSKGI